MVELGCWAGKDRHHANGPTPPAAQRERDRCQARRLPDRPGANKVVGTIPVGAESHSVAIGRGEGSGLPALMSRPSTELTRTPGDGACLLRPTYAAIIARVDRIIGAKGTHSCLQKTLSGPL